MIISISVFTKVAAGMLISQCMHLVLIERALITLFVVTSVVAVLAIAAVARYSSRKSRRSRGSRITNISHKTNNNGT